MSTGAFLLRRVVTSLLTLWAIVTITFMLLRILPGGPFDGERILPPDIQANLNAQYHLDESLWSQYGQYLSQLIRGDLGPSYKYLSRSVNDVVQEAFWVSVEVGGLALLLGLGFGVVFGLLAGMTERKSVDLSLTTVGVALLSTPSFIAGGLLVLVFALSLKWLPAARLSTPSHYLLPVLTLSTVPFAFTFMLIRTQVKTVKTAPFVQIKRAFGLTRLTIAWRHILRNAALPLLAILGPLIAALITGSFAVEFIFAIPGMGKHFINGVINRDYTLVIGLTLVYSIVLLTLNTLTELLNGLIDPRLRDAQPGRRSS